MTDGLLDPEKKERLIANRFVNTQGGKNNNRGLDEYVELLNRDSKVACPGYQTKESILAHSTEYPHLINYAKHFESISQLGKDFTSYHHMLRMGENEDGDKAAFRKWFSYIGELRSLVPQTSMLALSATCTWKISKRVWKVLNLKEDTLQIRMSPDKISIKLAVHKISNTLEMSMSWIVDGLPTDTFPRTLNCHNITGCHSVILYGVPSKLIDIVQEIGRVGRDGTSSVALLLYNSYHLSKCDEDVNHVYKTTECQRLALLKGFLTWSYIQAYQ
ncbi:uncharacterized protein LOC121377183 [Gigantopelta aegis]|uniref:uncharacterized protein LOC121377183 n=1 Tax=Gigantopelta aegis TaxID=1735272 RepID=UPI001B88E1C3|nr:uncharacterized protein LOC121377183 [Gigantopelta aegis]